LQVRVQRCGHGLVTVRIARLPGEPGSPLCPREPGSPYQHFHTQTPIAVAIVPRSLQIGQDSQWTSQALNTLTAHTFGMLLIGYFVLLAGNLIEGI
jgi:hypothetical protein